MHSPGQSGKLDSQRKGKCSWDRAVGPGVGNYYCNCKEHIRDLGISASTLHISSIMQRLELHTAAVNMDPSNRNFGLSCKSVARSRRPQKPVFKAPSTRYIFAKITMLIAK